MSHSTHAGFRGPGSLGPSGHVPYLAMRARFIEEPVPSGNLSLGWPARPYSTAGAFPGSQSHSRIWARGVGSHDEHPLAPLRGSDAASW